MPEDTSRKTNALEEEELAIEINENNHGATPTAPQAAGSCSVASTNTTSPGSAPGTGGVAAAPPTGTATTSGSKSSTTAFDGIDNKNDQGATTINFPTTLPPPPPPPLGVVSTALPHRHSMRYLLYPHYKPRPLRLPVDIDALLLVVGALVVPNPKGFIVTDETLVHGHSLWRFLVRLFGSSCLGRSEANESGTWRSLTRALSQWGDKKPERLDALLGATRWERECRTSEYFMRLPRGDLGEPIAVKGTFIVGISLKNPLSDPSFHPQFQAALNAVAPGLSPARYMMIVEQYLSTVWMSHEALDIERAICVHNRLAGGAAGVGGKRRNLWRTAAAEEALAKKEETPFQALVKAVAQVRGDSGLLHPHYVPRQQQQQQQQQQLLLMKGDRAEKGEIQRGEDGEGGKGKGGVGEEAVAVDGRKGGKGERDGRSGKVPTNDTLNSKPAEEAVATAAPGGGGEGGREGGRGTGVDVEAFLRVLVAVTESDADGYVVTDASQTGGHSLWTFIVRLLGPPCLGLKPLTEANTWFALAKGMTRMKESGEEGERLLARLKGGKEWKRECTVRPHPIRIPRGGGGEVKVVEEGEGKGEEEGKGNDSGEGLEEEKEGNEKEGAMANSNAMEAERKSSSSSSSDSDEASSSSTAAAATITAAASPPTPAISSSTPFPSTGIRKVRGTFLTGITLRPPGPGLEAALSNAIRELAPTFPPEQYRDAFEAYNTLWESHETLPMSQLVPLSSTHPMASGQDGCSVGSGSGGGRGGGRGKYASGTSTSGGCADYDGRKVARGRKRKTQSEGPGARVDERTGAEEAAMEEGGDGGGAGESGKGKVFKRDKATTSKAGKNEDMSGNNAQHFASSASTPSSSSTYTPPLGMGASAIHPLIVRADGEGGAEGQEVVLPPVLPLPSSVRHIESSIMVEM